MHYSLFILVTFEIIDKWCWWYFCQKMFFYFFFYFQVAICSVPIRKYNIVSSTLLKMDQCNQYLRVNGYVMTDDLKTCVFPANKKKTLRSLKRRKVWQRFAGWCDDNYIYAFAIYGEETICSTTHLHTALQGMILYAFLALIHTAI